MDKYKAQDERLYSNLIRLGEMMGDGLHFEPEGKWIEKEYRKTLRLLGLYPKKDTTRIDVFMQQRVNEVKCRCGGTFKQSRKGSCVAKCVSCGSKCKLARSKKKCGR